jgi:hypothetical protein
VPEPGLREHDMVNLQPGDVFVGGNYGYVTQHRKSGIFWPVVQYIAIVDDEGNQLCPNGLDVGPDGELYTAEGDPDGLADNDPHDVAYVTSDPPKLAAIIAKADDTAEIRTYNLDGVLQNTWNIEVDEGWTKTNMLKIDVACDGFTAYYTDRGRTIFKFNIETGTQLANFHQLDEDSEYIYADLALLPATDSGDILIVNMTNLGNGPRNAVAITYNGYWSDEVSPADSSYEVFLRDLDNANDLESFTVSLSPDDDNDEITAIAVYYDVCGFPGLARLQVNTANQVWFLDEF